MANFEFKTINPRCLESYFDEKVRLMCTFCKRYGKKATCPPNIQSILYYNNILIKYNKGIIIYKKYIINNDWQVVGEQSTKDLTKYLVKVRDKLAQNGLFCIAFSGGSCKNCKECTFPCRFPNKSLIPIEGTGINIIKLMKDFCNLDLDFPVKEYIYRIGLILFDKKP